MLTSMGRIVKWFVDISSSASPQATPSSYTHAASSSYNICSAIYSRTRCSVELNDLRLLAVIYSPSRNVKLTSSSPVILNILDEGVSKKELFVYNTSVQTCYKLFIEFDRY